MLPDHTLLEYRALCAPVSIVLVAGASQAELIDELLRARAVVRAAQEVLDAPMLQPALIGRLCVLAEAVEAYEQPGTPP